MGLPGAFAELVSELVCGAVDVLSRIGRWAFANPIAALGLLFLGVFFSWLGNRWFAKSVIFTADFWEGSPEGIRNLVWAMATVFAGAAGLYGLYLAGRRTAALDRQAEIAHSHRELSEQGQITERFTKAIEQLAHEEVAVRLGGIYALERVAKDSGRDLATIMETLAAYVRTRALWVLGEDEASDWGEDAENYRPSVDVAAAIAVLGRTIPPDSLFRTGSNVQRLDLRRVDLRGLDLPGANFSGFRFDKSCFAFATLSKTIFSSAILDQAVFFKASLAGAIFTEASLPDANLEQASLVRADFSGTVMRGASLKRASLYETDLSDVFLADSDLQGAFLTNTNLSHASLWDANLSNARFDGANLYRTYVRGTNFKGVTGLESDGLSNVSYRADKPPINVPEGVRVPPPDMPSMQDDEIPF